MLTHTAVGSVFPKLVLSRVVISCVPQTSLFGTLSTRILDQRLYGLLLVPKRVSKSKFHNRPYPVSIGTPLRDVFT